MGNALPESPLGGLVAYALITMTLVGTFGGALYSREIVGSLRRIRLRVSPPVECPDHPPIEHVALHARRLRAELHSLAPGTPMARRRGLSQAYDDLLVVACLALDVPDTLTGMDPGTDRDAERLRVEHQLELAGLRLIA